MALLDGLPQSRNIELGGWHDVTLALVGNRYVPEDIHTFEHAILKKMEDLVDRIRMIYPRLAVMWVVSPFKSVMGRFTPKKHQRVAIELFCVILV